MWCLKSCPTNMLALSIVLATCAPPHMAPAAEPGEPPTEPTVTKVFEDELWYRDTAAEPQVFEGVLRKREVRAGVGRINPFRLEMEGDSREVYAAGRYELFDGFVGRRVRIHGKPMEMRVVSKLHREIWPAEIALAPDEEVKMDPLPIHAATKLTDYQLEERVERVLRSEAEFTEAFRDGRRELLRKLGIERLDFERHVLVWVQGGRQANPSFSVSIDAVLATEDGVEVRWTMHQKVGGTFATVVVNPGALALIDRPAGEVHFRRQPNKVVRLREVP